MDEKKPTDEQNAAMKLYLDHLQSLKLRLAIVDDLISGRLRVVNDSIDAEFACLQLRKSLELIAFGSVAAHREIFTRAFADFAEHRRAKSLLKNLGKLHPGFYPKPARMTVQPDGIRHLADITTGFLNQDDFAFLYDTCSEALHERSPFRTDPKVIHFGHSITEWVTKIRTLLDLHWIQLAGSSDIWVVQLLDPVTGKAIAWFAI